MIKLNKFFKSIVTRAVSFLCAFGFSVAPLVSVLPSSVASADVVNGIDLGTAFWTIDSVSDVANPSVVSSPVVDSFSGYDYVLSLGQSRYGTLSVFNWATYNPGWVRIDNYTRYDITYGYMRIYSENSAGAIGAGFNDSAGAGSTPYVYPMTVNYTNYRTGLSYGSLALVGDHGVVSSAVYTFLSNAGTLWTESGELTLGYDSDIDVFSIPAVDGHSTVASVVWCIDGDYVQNTNAVMANNSYRSVTAMVQYTDGYGYWFSDPRGAGGDYTPVIEYENGVITWEDVNPGGVDVDYDIYDVTAGTIIDETSQDYWDVPSDLYGHSFSIRANVYLLDGTVVSDWSNVVLAVAPGDSGFPTIQLDSPVLNIASDLLYWNPVSYADIYDVQVLRGAEYVHYYYTSGTTFNLTFAGFFRVVAQSNSSSFTPSEPSNVIEYSGISFDLTMPLLSYNSQSNNLTWSSVSGAVSYRILRDGALLVSGLTELQYPLPMGFGSYNVVAVDADGNIGPASNTIAITPDSENSPYSVGYSAGYEAGRSAGYNAGFQAGQKTDKTVLAFFEGVIDVPIRAGRSLLNWDFFGFNVGDMFRSILSILFVLAVAKLVMYFV